MSSPPSPRVGPRPWVKLLVSLLVVAQFFVIFTVITSASSPNFPASPVARDLAVLTRPYAQAFFMHNAYRFYAPEPGPTNMLWVRYQYQDGTTRWQEMPRVQDFASRIPYQRHLALLLMLGMTEMKVAVTPDGQESLSAWNDPLAVAKAKYSPVGRACMGSFVRHLTHQSEYARSDVPNSTPVTNVEVYHVLHYIPTPDHTKLGWRYEDPRLYMAVYVGTYAPDGKLLPGESEYLQNMLIDEVFAYRIIERDFLDYLDRQGIDPTQDAALTAALEKFGMPLPFRWPILKNRRLLQPQPRDHLRALFEQVLLDDEIREARTQLTNPPRGFTPPQTPPIAQPSDRTRPAATGPKSVPSPNQP